MPNEAKEKEVKPVKTEKVSVEKNVLDKLIENSIAFQKLLTGLAGELKILNRKLSSLLAIFEEASKVFKERPKVPELPAELLEKINKLVDQNKTIAQGILLLERSLRELKERFEAGAAGYKPLPEF